jgi:hypothetical protein
MNKFFHAHVALSVAIAAGVMPAIALAASVFSDDFSDSSSGWVNTQGKWIIKNNTA